MKTGKTLTLYTLSGHKLTLPLNDLIINSCNSLIIQARSQDFCKGGLHGRQIICMHVQECKTRGVWGHAPPGNL